MEIKILEEEENPLLHRSEIRFSVTHEDATPSRLSVRDSLAAQLNRDSEEVVIHELDTKYGMRETIGHAKVYESSQDAKEIEHDHLLERNKIESEEEAESEPEEAEE